MHLARAHVRGRARGVAAVLTVLVVLGACSDGDGEKGSPDRAAPKGDVELVIGDVTVHGIGPTAELDRKTRARLLASVNRYVEIATVAPLLRGKDAKGLADLFAPTVSARVVEGGPDRAALSDDGVERATANLRTKTTPVTLDVLTAADGEPILVAARFRVQVGTETARARLTIARRAELSFEPAPDGSWLISAYRVVTRRETPGGATTTTAAEAS